MREKINDGGSAFPHDDSKEYKNGIRQFYASKGMTLRDWFAGMALQGMFASDRNCWDNESREIIGEMAYAAADAMIEEREVKYPS